MTYILLKSVVLLSPFDLYTFFDFILLLFHIHLFSLHNDNYDVLHHNYRFFVIYLYIYIKDNDLHIRYHFCLYRSRVHSVSKIFIFLLNRFPVNVTF